MKVATRCGYVAIVGRPNVGKSTLLNRFIGQKISITSRKPQTTRHKILGIKTIAQEQAQIVYVDTPGLHQITKGCDHAINRYMNKTVQRTLADVDVIVFMVEGAVWRDEDDWILNKISKLMQQRSSELSELRDRDKNDAGQGEGNGVDKSVPMLARGTAHPLMSMPIVLVVNKVDQIIPKERLLPYLELLSEKMNFADVFPISARRGINVDELEAAIIRLLPPQPFFYFPEQITDRPETFRVAEIIREKLIKSLGQELPYATSVIVEKFVLEGDDQDQEIKIKNQQKCQNKNNNRDDLTHSATGEKSVRSKKHAYNCSRKGVLHISAVIFVEREGQKAIVIGTRGASLKRIGTLARQELEKVFAKKVFLKLWVKVKDNWTDDTRKLSELGYV